MKRNGTCPSCGAINIVLSNDGNLRSHPIAGEIRTCSFTGLPKPGSVQEEKPLEAKTSEGGGYGFPGRHGIDR